jgi:hypothetical protein
MKYDCFLNPAGTYNPSAISGHIIVEASSPQEAALAAVLQEDIKFRATIGVSVTEQGPCPKFVHTFHVAIDPAESKQ